MEDAIPLDAPDYDPITLGNLSLRHQIEGYALSHRAGSS